VSVDSADAAPPPPPPPPPPDFSAADEPVVDEGSGVSEGADLPDADDADVSPSDVSSADEPVADEGSVVPAEETDLPDSALADEPVTDEDSVSPDEADLPADEAVSDGDSAAPDSAAPEETEPPDSLQADDPVTDEDSVVPEADLPEADDADAPLPVTEDVGLDPSRLDDAIPDEAASSPSYEDLEDYQQQAIDGNPTDPYAEPADTANLRDADVSDAAENGSGSLGSLADKRARDEGQSGVDAPLGPRVTEGVPVERATFDGRDAVVSGNWQECADKAVGHQDGHNTCGICSCANVANMCGKDVSEAQAVKCVEDNNIGEIDEHGDRNIYQDNLPQILSGLGIESTQFEVNSLEDIARPVEDGRGEIIAVNSGEFWNDPEFYDDGLYNHAIQVTGVARDPASEKILGFYVNDSGEYPGKGQFVTAERMEAAAFPREDDGKLIPQQNFATVTIDKWMNLEKKG
jgi:hypothetical protein